MPSILPHITFDTAAKPAHSIIWLHGLGADGADFLPVAEEITLPCAVRYIFPHAPLQAVTINGGHVMRSWYDIVASDIGSRQDAMGVRTSQAEIEKLIAQERARGVLPGNIYLAGFSQGGAIALHSGLRHHETLGGILALSTYLPLADTLAAEAHTANRDTPVFMAHGSSDPVVPYTLGLSSRTTLSQLGYPVEWHEYAMQHSVCPQELRDIETWLTQHLRP